MNSHNALISRRIYCCWNLLHRTTNENTPTSVTCLPSGATRDPVRQVGAIVLIGPSGAMGGLGTHFRWRSIPKHSLPAPEF